MNVTGSACRWRSSALRAVFILFAALLVVGTGCSAGWVAGALVAAPNKGHPPDRAHDPDPEHLQVLGVSRQLRVDVGPPAASLSVWVVDPPAGTPRGTILVLHGIRDRKDSMLGWGKKIAAAGYRSVLIDLRGHGRSSGDYLTYGVVDARDLSQMLDVLAKENLVAGPPGSIGAFGVSYGAATAIQLAAADARVRAVVAIASFSSLVEVVPDYARKYHVSWLISDRTMTEGLARAGREAGFDPASANPAAALRRSNVPVLLLHGRDDCHIPPVHAERLHAAAPNHTALILIEDEDHETIMADRSDTVERQALTWFGRALALPAPQR